MKHSTVITQLLFTEDEKCSRECIIANSILHGDAYTSEKIARILDSPENIHIISAGEHEQQERLTNPCLFECQVADVRKVIGATLVACEEETHIFVNYLYGYSKEKYCTLDFRDGCVFGLLDVLNHGRVSLTCEGVCDVYKELGNCTAESAVLLLILELLWQARDGDALLPERAGELTNLISGYASNEWKDGFKNLTRKRAIQIFLMRACARYEESRGFPSQLAEAVVTTFMYQAIGMAPKEKLLKLASDALANRP